ncbi:hypothetical protein M9H77_01733 [Catharanthus roseus]|uniref:Uncharacterized protein n=1 Tax=Catharanthus roseus TaxID=4058 RepID=A0ACC0C6E1_CATRO|nr:hypothetical protein M9H77_01733 [Catharanthus roseus]
MTEDLHTSAAAVDLPPTENVQADNIINGATAVDLPPTEEDQADNIIINGATAVDLPPTEDVPADNIITADEKKPSINNNAEKKLKKRGSFGFFKAALSMVRRSRSSSDVKKKPPPIEIPKPSDEEVAVPNNNSKGENWKKIVGSIRPLHVPDNNTPTALSPSTTVDCFDDLIPNASSCSFPSPSVYDGSSIGSMSQYASASNLQDLDDNNNSDNENDDPDEVFDAIGGDEMIDAKAEEFIAQFYLQMKLQI